jgi:predicted enzyme related to lactoylglutathione lyase
MRAEGDPAMILGGNATLYVSNMDAAVRFYTVALGMRLRMRAGDHWAEVEAGKDLVIGLHPARPGREPGSTGAVQIGLLVEAPLESVLQSLARQGVEKVGTITDAGPGMRFATIRDMDRNEVYLWEQSEAAPGKPRAAKRPATRPARRAAKRASSRR